MAISLDTFVTGFTLQYVYQVGDTKPLPRPINTGQCTAGIFGVILDLGRAQAIVAVTAVLPGFFIEIPQQGAAPTDR